MYLLAAGLPGVVAITRLAITACAQVVANKKVFSLSIWRSVLTEKYERGKAVYLNSQVLTCFAVYTYVLCARKLCRICNSHTCRTNQQKEQSEVNESEANNQHSDGDTWLLMLWRDDRSEVSSPFCSVLFEFGFAVAYYEYKTESGCPWPRQWKKRPCLYGPLKELLLMRNTFLCRVWEPKSGLVSCSHVCCFPVALVLGIRTLKSRNMSEVTQAGRMVQIRNAYAFWLGTPA